MDRIDVKKLLWIVIGAMMVGNSNAKKKITGPADVVLVVPKITECTQLDAMKEQLPKILDHFEMGQDKIRIAVVSVDRMAHPPTGILLNLTGNEAAYKKVVQEWQCPTTTERRFDDYGTALANARWMFYYHNDGRPKLVIVFFTGYTVNHEDAKNESSLLTNAMGAVYVNIVDQQWQPIDPLDYTGGDSSRVVNTTWTTMVDGGVANLTEKIKDDLLKMTTTTSTTTLEATTPATSASASLPTWVYGVIGAFVVIAIIVIGVIVFVMIRKKKENSRQQSSANGTSARSPSNQPNRVR